MYYQQYNGPLNYQLDSSNGLIPLEHNDYPLISVITKPIPSVTETSFTASSAAAITISITDIVMTPNGILTSTEVIHYSTSLHYTISLLSTTSSFLTNSTSSSNVTTTSLTTASMESTPDQSTGSLILAGSISSVFILLVVTILVILIVSVLVCRRKQLGTTNTNGDSERVVDEQKQDERQNILSNISANAAYGIIGGNEKSDDDYSNPAYGINTIMTQSINEELLVYDEPRTMNNEQVVIVMPADNEAYTQQKEEEEDNEGATGGGVCTEGFMDLSLLVAKAATPVGSLADNTLAENNEGRWVISGNTFNCTTAAVTEVLLGVDIRSKDGNRNKYPSIEIWDISSSIYNRYRLGVYQPEDDSSVVRLYNATTSSTETIGRIRVDSISESHITICSSNKEIDRTYTSDVFMVHLTTDPPNCFQNVFTETEINTNSLSVTNVMPVNDTRAFPDTVYSSHNQDTSKHYPNIYLKRSSELIHALTVDASAATSSNGNSQFLQ
uniref:Uncharacterized protein n=1 Tax=Amphimedon queenslandica TaxID=400682 RepID=A0A1X7SYY2_AMPQE